MIRRRKDLGKLDLADSDELGHDPASATELLREVLKELRQIRGILGHLAKDVAKESTSARGDETRA
ncbi:MAG: hypothetical protein AB7F89_24040 [Pirellulaceae bacterium]